MDKPSKAHTPGYKALLVSEETFRALQKLQKLGGAPSRLSVSDLADAAISLQLPQSSLILEQAKKMVIHSLSTQRNAS
jgi:hypothetical protein